MSSACIKTNVLTDNSETFDVVVSNNEDNPFHSASIVFNCVDRNHAERLIEELCLANVTIKEEV